jgi:flagellar biogenesis protein FliO
MKSDPLAGTIPSAAMSAAPVELRRVGRWLQAGWWRRILGLRRTTRRLRLCETLSLGERRFVAVVEFERARFLVGGTSASLVLLAQLRDIETESAPARTDEQEEQA